MAIAFNFTADVASDKSKNFLICTNWVTNVWNLKACLCGPPDISGYMQFYIDSVSYSTWDGKIGHLHIWVEWQ